MIPPASRGGNVYQSAINGAEYIFYLVCALAVLACCLLARWMVRRKKGFSTLTKQQTSRDIAWPKESSPLTRPC